MFSKKNNFILAFKRTFGHQFHHHHSATADVGMTTGFAYYILVCRPSGKSVYRVCLLNLSMRVILQGLRESGVVFFYAECFGKDE